MLKLDIFKIVTRLLALFALLLLPFLLRLFIKLAHVRQILIVFVRHDPGEIFAAAHLVIDGVRKLLFQCPLFRFGGVGIQRAAHMVTITVASIFVLVSKHGEVPLIDLFLVDVLGPTDESLVGLHEGHKGGIGRNQGGSHDQKQAENVEQVL